jgi:hypothetical protein
MEKQLVDIKKIRELIQEEKIVWRNHILVRMQQRKIKIQDVINCILSGEIIEYYPLDYPYSSCLVLGRTDANQVLHVVCAVGQDRVWMISAYYPDRDQWHQDFKTRRDKK